MNDKITNDTVNRTDNNEAITDSLVNIPQDKQEQGQKITDTTVNSSSIKSDKVYNIQNLKPYNKTDRVLSSEEAKRRGSKGGIKSGEVRRQKKTMRETLENALKIELSPEKLEELGADISLMNGETSVLSAIIASTIREAINGDTKAIQFVRDSIGEQPVAKTENVTEVITKDDTEMIANLTKALTG